MTTTTRRYGWKADLPDQQDLHYSAPRIALPPSMDMRPNCPPVYDQLSLGSCTSNSACGAFEFELKKQGLTDFMPSRLFVYYEERRDQGTTAYDSGASIRESVKVLHKRGVCAESEWPYDLNAYTQEPPESCYQDARKHLTLSYLRVQQDLPQMKTCLAQGYPILIGFTVYPSFESDEVARSGMVPLPAHGERSIGGHAVLVVGFHDNEQMFICRNSWGPDWGQSGYFMMPYAYLLSRSLASDFWTLRTVE